MSQADYTRWIFASIAKAMKEVAEDCDLPCLVDSLDERTAKFMEAENNVTVRISGPSDQEVSKGYHKLLVDVSVLIMGTIGGRRNAYDFCTWIGSFSEALTDDIPVFNYGSEIGDHIPGDDTTLVQLGCLVPRPGRPVNTFMFGQVEKDLKTQQVEVNAQLVMEVQQ